MTAPSASYQPIQADPVARRLIILLVGGVPFLCTLLAIVLLWNRLVSWPDIVLFLGLAHLTGLGISLGFHRMVAHRSFEAHPVVRFVLLALGNMAVEGGPLTWGSTHLMHHANSDEDGDPHSPVDGFVHAHMGWMVKGAPIRVDQYGARLLDDPMVVFFERTAALWVGLGLLIPFLLAGWTGLLWGGAVRIFYAHHVTWCVNSWCHTFGRRDYDTPDRSRNVWLIGVLALGEGWHNNHHAFPASAFHGLEWWQIDVSGYILRVLERVGLVWDVKRVPEGRKNRRRLEAEL